MKKKLFSVLLAISMLAVSGPLLPVMAEDNAELSMETVIEPQYEMEQTFSDGLAAVQKDGLWGYINESGKMVIQPKYQTPGFFREKSAVVAFEDGTLHEGQQSIYILREDAQEIPLTAPGWNAGGYWDQQAPLYYDPAVSTLTGLKNHAQDGVVVAGGSAYLPDGTRIEPEFKGMNGLTPYKATDFGFYQNYQDYTVLGPCVNGIIPCKALFYSMESYGQCFFMDKNGKILNVFHTLDDPSTAGGGHWGITYCYAPDPETGLIAMRFAQEPADFWTFVDDASKYESHRATADSNKFRSFMIRETGLVWSENIAVLRKMNNNIQLFQYKDSSYSPLDNKNYEDATMFSEGYCSVKENGSWHFIDAAGKAYQAAGPDGGTAKITALGLFENGVAPAYDETSGKFYLVSRILKDGVFQAVPNSDNLAGDVYFPGFTPGKETTAFMGFTDLGSLIAIKEGGKYGFAKVNGSVDPTPDNPFIDVNENDYFFAPVLWAVNHKPQITNGTSPNTFSPTAFCTRGQVVTFLWRASGKPAPTKTDNPFSDVSKNDYYYDAVLWAVEKGITKGTSGSTFSPNENCTRGQVVTFLWRTNNEPKPTSTVNPFKDVAKGVYYYDAVLWAVEKDITKGT
ncbi:MAG: S-layer homology domain-containing protein, partial [Firmicutes bacterium]|nr:S-layer homology domain-containing protein [Bacillota bacterium]